MQFGISCASMILPIFILTNVGFVAIAYLEYTYVGVARGFAVVYACLLSVTSLATKVSRSPFGYWIDMQVQVLERRTVLV